MKIKNIIQHIKNRDLFKAIKIKILNKKSSHLNDYDFLVKMGRIKFGRKFNIDNPVTFNEKLNWLKLNDRKEIHSIIVDKYEAKSYINSVLGENKTIPTLFIYNDINEINFEELPKQFVIKTTHDSGGVVICKNKAKFNYKKCLEKLNRSLNTNYYLLSREWPYKNARRRIIVEPYLVDESKVELKDYKIFCFNGKAEYIEVDFNREIKHKLNTYDLEWNPLNFCDKSKNDYSANIPKPKRLKDMINAAEKISKDFKFLRVDMYSIEDNFYVGELTLYPGAGFIEFEPRGIDLILGEKLKLED